MFIMIWGRVRNGLPFYYYPILNICNLSAIPKAHSGVVISYSKIELSTAVSVSPLTTDSQKNPENLRVMLYYKCGRAGLGPSHPPWVTPPPILSTVYRIRSVEDMPKYGH